MIVWMRMWTGVDLNFNCISRASSRRNWPAVLLTCWGILLVFYNISVTVTECVSYLVAVNSNRILEDGSTMTQSHWTTAVLTTINNTVVTVSVHLVFFVMATATGKWKRLWSLLQQIGADLFNKKLNNRNHFIKFRRFVILGIAFLVAVGYN